MIQSLQILRFIMALLQSAALAFGYHHLDPVQQQWLPLWVALPWGVLALTQALPALRVESEQRILCHLLTDCSLLTAMLYLAGGATNPFVSWYLVPIAVAAATLSIRSTAVLTTGCLLAYSWLMNHYQGLAILSPQAHSLVLHDMAGHPLSHGHALHLAQDGGVNWHLAGMWLNFGLSALLITWFVTRMAAELRQQQAELAAIREQRLRDEQLLGIATLAAGTVHELGTPLSTLSILAEDLRQQVLAVPLQEDVRLLAQQIDHCKRIVHNLSQSVAQQQGDGTRLQPAGAYLQEVLTHWQLLHPQVPLRKTALQSDTLMQTDASLEQALINLLNNGAEASPGGIEVSLAEDSAGVVVSIRDFGSGLQMAAERLGKPFTSTRGAGRGLGLFLSRAAIERLGGELHIDNHPQGGAVVQVHLRRVKTS